MTHIPPDSPAWWRAGAVPPIGTAAWPRSHVAPSPHDDRGDEPGRYGAGYGDVMPEAFAAHAARARGEADLDRRHFDRWRSEHLEQLDRDYRAWRRDRFCREFDAWRNAQRAVPDNEPQREARAAEERSSRGDPPRLGLGARAGGAPSENVDTFFERS
jgi:hypothetical protein